MSLTFSGRDGNGYYLRTDSVVIRNITQGWQDALCWPDTVLTLTPMGIEVLEPSVGFLLQQNAPNPFDANTSVILTIADPGDVELELWDMAGRVVGMLDIPNLSPGSHQLSVSLRYPGTYLLTARQNDKTSSVKMLNVGNGTAEMIQYAGVCSMPQKVPMAEKKESVFPFSLGDEMEFVGYAIVDVDMVESAHLLQQLDESQPIILQFEISPCDAHPCPGTPVVMDYDLNSYPTVQLGTQCWLAANLRTTHYADGSLIGVSHVSPTISSLSIPYFYAPDDNVSYIAAYGYLYNWPAAMHCVVPSASKPSSVQGVCPDGWHIPSRLEWEQLSDYLISKNEFSCGSDSSYIGKALAADTAWIHCDDAECAVGNHSSSNNATGFSALPAGGFRWGTISYFGNNILLWSSSENEGYSDGAYCFILEKCLPTFSSGSIVKEAGCSVRCVRDEDD